MIEPTLAQRLQESGLIWQPAKRDMFVIPDGDLARDVFTLTDQTILIQQASGQYVVTFHGSVEWALDHVMLADVVWLPSETQLREAIQLRLGGERASVELAWRIDGFRCTIVHLGQQYQFEGNTAEHAYALALLHLLQAEQQLHDTPPS